MRSYERKFLAPEGAAEGGEAGAPPPGQPTGPGGQPAEGGEAGAPGPQGGGGGGGAPGEGVEAAPATTPALTWQERRLGEVSAAKRQVEAKANQLAYENALLKAQLDELAARGTAQPAAPTAPAAPTQPAAAQPPAQRQPRVPTQEEFQHAVRQEAAGIAAANAFAERCNATAVEGRKAFEDFDASLAKFAPLGGLDPEVVDIAIDTGSGHQILHHLAGNLDEYERIRVLPPVKRAIELDRLSQRLQSGAVPEVSRAPRPPSTIGAGRGSGAQKDPSKMTMAEYTAWRNASKKAS